MLKRFDACEIEKRWQKYWQENKIYDTGPRDTSRPKEYVLVELPYPSGNLHIGHWHAFAVPDIYVRFKRMSGTQVLYPMGFDAFGLPAENAAIKNQLDPKKWTEQNMLDMRKQLDSMGNAFNWEHSASTTDEEYYRWTQWMFTEFFKRGIAYRGEGQVNWCLCCQTVIANEQVHNVEDDDCCERCDSKIEKKNMPQWMLRITDYADRLVDDLKDLDWPEAIKEAQRQWIGRAEGYEIDFKLNVDDYDGVVVFASNNKSKCARLKYLLSSTKLKIDLKTPEEIGISDFKVKEDGETLSDNSLKKARTLANLIDLPVLADDTGFFIAGSNVDPVKVKRNALQDLKEEELSQDQISNLVLEHYKSLATKQGGEVKATWKHVMTLIMPDGEEKQVTANRPVILTNKVNGQIDHNLPIRSLYIVKATGKYANEQNDQETELDLQPITDELNKLFQNAISVFTTRPDTLFGATYIVLAPEHPYLTKYNNLITNREEVDIYLKNSLKKRDQDRLDISKEKTGVKLEGLSAKHPLTNEILPIYVADYVLGNYGTGAVMAVPAHDERDYDFATKFSLPIKPVIENNEEPLPFTQHGKLINSEKFTGLNSEEAKTKITNETGGKTKRTYRLRDWSIGRQRYWGVPIPIVYDPEGKPHTVPDKYLPWKLPEDVDFTPTGLPPLAKSKELLERTEKIFGTGWRPEVETMDTFVDSSWYFLRYIDHINKDIFSSTKAQHDWMPVDIYFGGPEHTTMHLLYSRFWQKVLFDMGLVTCDEPYNKRVNRGLILGPDGNKMSKSKGNVINPDEQVADVGSDTVKMYLAFMGPYEGSNYPWDMGGIAGIRRFLERFYGLSDHIKKDEPEEITRLLHQTIEKVTNDIPQFKFNTAISALMIFVNRAERLGLTNETYRKAILLIAPFAPHLSEELWQRQKSGSDTEKIDSIHLQSFPKANPDLLKSDTVEITIQVNGKKRGSLNIPRGEKEAYVLTAIKNDDGLAKHLDDKVKKVIYVQDKILNIVLEK